jgi:hypothetical protein
VSARLRLSVPIYEANALLHFATFVAMLLLLLRTINDVSKWMLSGTNVFSDQVRRFSHNLVLCMLFNEHMNQCNLGATKSTWLEQHRLGAFDSLEQA